MRTTVYHTVEQAIALTLLVVLGPLLAAIGITLLILQGRPVLFAHDRAGLDGEIFRILKFRTMVNGATDADHASQVTPAGRFLRRIGLDELPQLINIVRGEMSFIGPRPTLPEQVARYRAADRRRLSVRPGLTGWAQVNGRNAIPWDERIALDVWYVDNRSLTVDLSILLRTVRTVFGGEGVYGTGGNNPDFRPAACTSGRTHLVTNRIPSS